MRCAYQSMPCGPNHNVALNLRNNSDTQWISIAEQLQHAMDSPPATSDSSGPRSTPALRESRPLLACAAIGCVLLVSAVLGHDGRRIAQMTALAAPVLVWMVWPLRTRWMNVVRSVLAWLWVMVFALDGAARAYLLDAYQAAPDSAMVLGAVANTNPREAAEFMTMHWRSLLLWSGALVVAGVASLRYAHRGARNDGPARAVWPRWAIGLMCVVLLAAALAYASKPWRRLHPVAFWSGWSQSVQTLKASWANQDRERHVAAADAKAALPVITREGPATVVLVITDSINRDNMALYGYGRATTPRLLEHKAQLGAQLTILPNAWSVDASTLPALRNIFNFGQPAQAASPHLIALARAAGYKTWWISNHDDIAIEQEHARHADVVDMVNRTPGRASASLDGELLDCVQEALEDQTERKFIIVHLMGAHPHYNLRFPANANPFDEVNDTVEQALVKAERPAWLRRFRQEYDAAMLYHDFVVAELLRLTRQSGKPDSYRAWMYLSDHGQEVGHGSDRVGHSPSTPSGYRIPAIAWRDGAGVAAKAAVVQQPFRSDWTGWTVADLLNMQWAGNQPARNVLHADYRWQAPEIPAKVRSFNE